tara:strand:- start:28 stop:498 length:471 start_codon:yes stop_codon:yes gene_type:complete
VFGESIATIQAADVALKKLLGGFQPAVRCEYWVAVVVSSQNTRAVFPVTRGVGVTVSLNSTRPESVLFRLASTSLVPVVTGSSTSVLAEAPRIFNMSELCLALLPRLPASDLGPALLGELIDGGIPIDIALAVCEKTDFNAVKNSLVRSLANRSNL